MDQTDYSFWEAVPLDSMLQRSTTGFSPAPRKSYPRSTPDFTSLFWFTVFIHTNAGLIYTHGLNYTLATTTEWMLEFIKTQSAEVFKFNKQFMGHTCLKINEYTLNIFLDMCPTMYFPMVMATANHLQCIDHVCWYLCIPCTYSVSSVSGVHSVLYSWWPLTTLSNL